MFDFCVYGHSYFTITLVRFNREEYFRVENIVMGRETILQVVFPDELDS